MTTTKKRNSNHKQVSDTINSLFATPSFWPDLCEYSNNNLKEVTKNTSLIINYYLISKDRNISYSIPELFSRIERYPKRESNILVIPSNEYYKTTYKFTGVNSRVPLLKLFPVQLETLDSCISFYPENENDCYTPIYKDITKSIEESFECPKILYKSILKQPHNKEVPVVVGTDEHHYYTSVLEVRLKNAEEELQRTCAKIGQSAMKKIVAKKPILVLAPKKGKGYEISEKDIENNITGLYIPASDLAFITLPSKYDLINTCALNKKKRNGELLDINTGEDYQYKPEEPKQLADFYYSRWETVSVTDTFQYSNDEFTEDISYDIDLIYGYLDTNNARHKVTKNHAENIKQIKSRDDITVRRVGKKYLIRNGRHRLLYLKKFYVDNYETYKEVDQLAKLKRIVTIPMNVESTLVDSRAHNYLIRIKNLYPNSSFIKIDINHDRTELFITLGSKVYLVKNSADLSDLYQELLNNNLNNDFYYGEHTTLKQLDYEKMFDYLILTFREEIYNMTLLDIINYVLNNGYYIGSLFYRPEVLNYHAMYQGYADIQHDLQIGRIYNVKRDIVKKTENKQRLKEIGTKIIQIIKNNPELLNLSWKDLYNFLMTYQEFQEFDSTFLEEAANVMGYQKYKVQKMYEEEKKDHSLRKKPVYKKQ